MTEERIVATGAENLGAYIDGTGGLTGHEGKGSRQQIPRHDHSQGDEYQADNLAPA